MLELSFENHFKFGYNHQPFTFRQTVEDNWYASYGTVTQANLDFKAACIDVAKKIRYSTKSPLYLFYSGGVDSEIMILAFLEAKINFNTVVLKFSNGYNDHDLFYALNFCKKYHIDPIIINIDIEDLFDSKGYEKYFPIYCLSPIMHTTIVGMEKVDGYPVLGSGDLFIGRNLSPDDIKKYALPWEQKWLLYDGQYENYDGNWYHRESERTAGWYRYLQWRNREGCAGFFQYTPEIALSFLTDDLLKDYIKKNKIVSILSKKLEIYKRYFDIEERPKYHGHEKIMNKVEIVKKELFSRWPSANGSHKTLLQSFVTHLHGLNKYN